MKDSGATIFNHCPCAAIFIVLVLLNKHAIVLRQSASCCPSEMPSPIACWPLEPWFVVCPVLYPQIYWASLAICVLSLGMLVEQYLFVNSFLHLHLLFINKWAQTTASAAAAQGKGAAAVLTSPSVIIIILLLLLLLCWKTWLATHLDWSVRSYHIQYDWLPCHVFILKICPAKVIYLYE